MIDSKTQPDANLTWEIVRHLNAEIAREHCRTCGHSEECWHCPDRITKEED